MSRKISASRFRGIGRVASVYYGWYATTNCKEKKHINRVSKPNIFWAPSLETARKIDDEDTVQSIETARYRFTASMADLERCYDEEASRLRAAFVAEVAPLYQNEDA